MLNPDASLRPGALQAMTDVLAAHPRAGFVGPRLENLDGSSWVAAFHFPSFANEVAGSAGIGALARRFPRLIADAEQPVRVDWVTGTATLIRWTALEALGNMDDGYFLYFEEVDYMRSGRRLGWESWHAPAARVVHDAGASTGIENGQARRGRTPDYVFEAWARYFSKNHGAAYARMTAAGKMLAMLFAETHRRMRGKPSGVTEGYLRDFARKVLFAPLSPPPQSRYRASAGAIASAHNQ
jgi:GT2 family glycosyltransferase